MKVLANGGLNLSELDGWWVEAYAPDIGWAIGDGKEHGEDPAWDAAEADAMYQLLENEIMPDFYECAQRSDPPAKWPARVRESMARLSKLFTIALRATARHGSESTRRSSKATPRRCFCLSYLKPYLRVLHRGQRPSQDDRSQTGRRTRRPPKPPSCSPGPARRRGRRQCQSDG